jgi:hypothetical protein
VVDGAAVSAAADGVFTRYAVEADTDADADAGDTSVPVTLVRPAGPAPDTATGVLDRASAPADKHFDTVAAEYRVDVPDDLPPGTILRLHWSGDVGRAYVGDTLVADQYFSGRAWDIGVDRLPTDGLRAEGLRLRVLPLHPDAPVYVPREAAGAAESVAITHAEWITRRRWSVRAG